MIGEMKNLPQSIRSWVEQFPLDDQKNALDVISELKFVTTERINIDLIEYASRLVRNLPSKSKVIILPLAPIEDLRRNGLQDLFFKDKPPFPASDEKTGSEHHVALAVRTVLRSNEKKCIQKSKQIMTAWTRPQMANVHLLVLTDNVSSGTQAIQYLDKVNDSLAIVDPEKKRIKVTLLTWATTECGSKRVEQWIAETKGQFSAVAIRRTPSFTDIQDEFRRTRIVDFFSRYAPGVNDSKQSLHNGLGYKGIGSTLITAGSSCPNTVPHVLHAGCGEILPLFKNRQIDPEITQWVTELDAQSKNRVDYTIVAKELKQLKLVRAARRMNSRDDLSWHLLLICVAGFGREEAMGLMGATYGIFWRTEDRLMRLGYITTNFLPTERGRQIVRSYGSRANVRDFKSGVHLMKEDVTNERFVYYPLSVRGVR